MIERTRDSMKATAWALASVAGACAVGWFFGDRTMLGAIGVVGFGLGVWWIAYAMLGEGQDDPREKLIDEAFSLLGSADGSANDSIWNADRNAWIIDTHKHWGSQ